MFEEIPTQDAAMPVIIGLVQWCITASRYGEQCNEDNDKSLFCIKCFNNNLLGWRLSNHSTKPK